MKLIRTLIFVFSFFIALTAEGVVMANDPENSIQIELKDGNVIIELLPDIAPNHVNRIKELAREGFYDGVPFHRVIEGFMAQTGDVQFGNINYYDPTSVGRGGSQLPDLIAEFSDIPFVRGAVGMARSQNPDSANYQFFLMFEEAAHLNGKYTVVGRVISGIEVMMNIKKGNSSTGLMYQPDYISRAWTIENK